VCHQCEQEVGGLEQLRSEVDMSSWQSPSWQSCSTYYAAKRVRFWESSWYVRIEGQPSECDAKQLVRGQLG